MATRMPLVVQQYKNQGRKEEIKREKAVIGDIFTWQVGKVPMQITVYWLDVSTTSLTAKGRMSGDANCPKLEKHLMYCKTTSSSLIIGS